MLRILYSSMVLTDEINNNYRKTISPLENYYKLTKNNDSILLDINFKNIKQCYYEGKIIPQRLKLFEVLKYYHNIQEESIKKKIFN